MEHLIKDKGMIAVCFNVKNSQGVVEIWLRMSGQVYNSLEDYKKLGQYILELSKQ